jgi:hypothetical protein
MRLKVKDVLLSMYGGLRTCTDGGVYMEATSWGGCITSLALGVFVVLILTSYTSNLTYMLVRRTNNVQYKNIDEAVQKGASMCMINARIEPLLALYPTAVIAAGPDGKPGFEERYDAFKALQAGLCQVSLAQLEDIEEYVSLDRGANCELTRTGEPVFFVQVGIPLGRAPELQAMYYHMQKLIDLGRYQQLQEKSAPQSTCADKDAVEEESSSFSLEDMLGVFFITGLILFLGLIVSVVDSLYIIPYRNVKKDVPARIDLLNKLKSGGVKEEHPQQNGCASVGHEQQARTEEGVAPQQQHMKSCDFP